MDLGRGLTFTEFDVSPEVSDELGPWHSNEHVPERSRSPGPLGAALPVRAPAHYCAFYRAETVDVFPGAPYQALFSNLSEATSRVTAGINGTRFVGEIVRERGTGYGGLLHRFRIGMDPARDPDVTDWYDANAETIMALPGVVRTLLASPRRHLPKVTDPHWLFFVEGYREDALVRAGAMIDLPELSAHRFRLEHLFA